MKTAVSSTSIDAYYAMICGPKMGRQQAQIVAFLNDTPHGATRNEIAESTGIRVASTCGRIAELIKAGVVEERGRRPCSISGVASHVVKLVPKQGEMFGAAA